MMKIMENVQGYLPTTKITRELEVPNTGGQNRVLKMEDDQSLIGGDQLTVARMRGAQRIRGNSEKSAERFDGFVANSRRLACENVFSRGKRD